MVDHGPPSRPTTPRSGRPTRQHRRARPPRTLARALARPLDPGTRCGRLGIRLAGLIQTGSGPASQSRGGQPACEQTPKARAERWTSKAPARHGCPTQPTPWIDNRPLTPPHHPELHMDRAVLVHVVGIGLAHPALPHRRPQLGVAVVDTRPGSDSRRGGAVGMGDRALPGVGESDRLGSAGCRGAGVGGPPWCWVRQPSALWWTGHRHSRQGDCQSRWGPSRPSAAGPGSEAISWIRQGRVESSPSS